CQRSLLPLQSLREVASVPLRPAKGRGSASAASTLTLFEPGRGSRSAVRESARAQGAGRLKGFDSSDHLTGPRRAVEAPSRPATARRRRDLLLSGGPPTVPYTRHGRNALGSRGDTSQRGLHRGVG